jgi:predicted outer membrane repeat protein
MVDVQTGDLTITDSLDANGDLQAYGFITVAGMANLAGNLTGNGITFNRAVTANGTVDQRFDAGLGTLWAADTIIKTTPGHLTLSGDAIVDLDGQVQVAGGGAFFIDDDVDAESSLLATGGGVTLNATAYLAGDVTGDGITFNGDVTADGTGSQIFDATTDALTTGDSITKTGTGNLTLRGGSGGVDVDLAGAVSVGSGNLSITADNGDVQVGSDLASVLGGVSIISTNGQIYTADGSGALNVAITGYSDGTTGVDLPYGSGKAAIVVKSSQTLSVGESCILTTNGVYDPNGGVDDRDDVDFLVNPEGGKNPGQPIDSAIYLASTDGDINVDSQVGLIPSGGMMVIDANDSVSFGSAFESFLAGNNVDRLEVCSRVTGTLNDAVVNGTLPYASNPESVAGWFSEGYVLRGENPDVSTGAWVLYETGIAPVIWYVDNDAPNDPCHGNPDYSDPNENGSLEHPFDSIQEAIDVAGIGDTVTVLSGAYAGTGNCDIDFLGKAITVRSENGPEDCIIDCNGAGRGFYFHSGEDQNSILDGLTIKEGKPGISCNASPHIANCVLADNWVASSWGGGMSNYGRATRLTGCVFINNVALAGGAIFNYGDLTINNCIFLGNLANSFYPETGGGALCSYSDSSFTITNSLFVANYCASHAGGGAINAFENAEPSRLINCSFSDNYSEGNGGAISCLGSELLLNNCILWNNTCGQFGPAVYASTSSYGTHAIVNISHNNIEDGPSGIFIVPDSMVDWGNGNIDADPKFVSMGHWDWGEWIDGDYHLQADSPCTDAGDPNYVTDANDFDIEGNMRVLNCRVDMGAYEYVPERYFDLNSDGIVNLGDFAILAFYWADSNCVCPDRCEGCDFDESGIIDKTDLRIFCEYWLTEYPVKFDEYSLDSDPGWTTTGQWAFGQPTGGGGTSYGNPDPTSGRTGLDVYGVNLRGDYSTTVGGPHYVTAGPFDCKDYSNVSLKFARWLNTDEPGYVESTIEVSNTGGEPWTKVWEHTRSQLTDSSWRLIECDVSSLADNQETVYIRWGYEIKEYAYPYSGWNIDDVELWGNPVRD